MIEQAQQLYPIQNKQQYLISKYDSFINYIKHLNLHLSVATRDGNRQYKEILKSLLTQLDKIVEDYNSTIIMYNNLTPIYISLSPLAFVERRAQTLVKNNQMRIENRDFSLLYKFVQWKRGKFYFVTELFKKTEAYEESNQVLKKYEGLFMREIINKCRKQGFFQSDTQMTLLPKRKTIGINYNRSPLIINQNQCFLLLHLKSIAEDFLKLLTKMFSGEYQCRHCKKYLMFDSKTKMFEPPTIICQPASQEERQNRCYHESCCVKYFNASRK